MSEVNPLGRALLAQGTVAVVLFKVLLTTLALYLVARHVSPRNQRTVLLLLTAVGLLAALGNGVQLLVT